LQLQRELYLTALDISDAGLKSDKILESLQGPVAKVSFVKSVCGIVRNKEKLTLISRTGFALRRERRKVGNSSK